MRKYRRFHGVLLIRILGAFVFLVPTAWLFFRFRIQSDGAGRILDYGRFDFLQTVFTRTMESDSIDQ
jgi:hypothetical protein